MEIGTRCYMSKNFRLINDNSDIDDAQSLGKIIPIWLSQESNLRANLMLESGEIILGITQKEFKEKYPKDLIEHFFNFYYMVNEPEIQKMKYESFWGNVWR